MEFITMTLISLLIGSAIVYSTFGFLKELRNTEIQRNQMAGAILHALREGEKHGYELSKWINTYYPELAKPRPSAALYPVLWNLEQSGFISSRTEIDPINNRLRRFYSLKQSGTLDRSQS
jgi:DNA-binding PadR family transcriptional regulator